MNTFNAFSATTLLTLATATSAAAQAVITATDLFAVGSRYQMATDESPTAQPGNNGTNLTWTFQGLQSDFFTIVEVKQPSESPFSDLLPGNRAALEDTDVAAEYLTVSPTQLLSHGRVFQEDGIQAAVALDPPMVLLNLPAQYYQIHTGVSRSQLTSYFGFDPGLGFTVDSIRVRTRIAYQSEVGGWGTVTTPLGTFNAVKQFLLENVTDSVDFYRADQDLWLLGVDVSTSAQPSWSWWSPEHDLPLVRLFDEDNNGIMDRAVWIEADLNTTAIDDRAAVGTLDVFPNPAMDQITVPLEGMGLAAYAILDAQGRLVQQGRLSRERDTVPVAHLERGAYILRLDQGGAISQARVVLQ
jgi:hypothetical protein